MVRSSDYGGRNHRICNQHPVAYIFNTIMIGGKLTDSFSAERRGLIAGFTVFFSISLVVSTAFSSNCATSVFAGIAIFSVTGFMSVQLGAKVDEVVKQGVLP